MILMARSFEMEQFQISKYIIMYKVSKYQVISTKQVPKYYFMSESQKEYCVIINEPSIKHEHMLLCTN